MSAFVTGLVLRTALYSLRGSTFFSPDCWLARMTAAFACFYALRFSTQLKFVFFGGVVGWDFDGPTRSRPGLASSLKLSHAVVKGKKGGPVVRRSYCRLRFLVCVMWVATSWLLQLYLRGSEREFTLLCICTICLNPAPICSAADGMLCVSSKGGKGVCLVARARS